MNNLIPGKLSKRIPARTRTVEFYHVKLDFTTATPTFFNVRASIRSSISCFWCKRKFEEGETIALGFMIRGNKMLCSQCATVAIHE